MLARNLLQFPLFSEFSTQRIQIRDAILARLQYRILGTDTAVRRDAQVEGCEERVRHAVGGELDELVLVQALRDEVAEGVVFLVEGEDGRVGDSCVAINALFGMKGMRLLEEERTCVELPCDLLLAGFEQELRESFGEVNKISWVHIVCLRLSACSHCSSRCGTGEQSKAESSTLKREMP